MNFKKSIITIYTLDYLLLTYLFLYEKTIISSDFIVWHSLGLLIFALFTLNLIFDFRNFFNPVSYSTLIYIAFSFLGNCVYPQVDLFNNSIQIFYISNSYLIFHVIGIYFFAIFNDGFIKWLSKHWLNHVNSILIRYNKPSKILASSLLAVGFIFLSVHYIFIVGDLPIFRSDVEDFRVTSKAGRGQFIMLGTNLVILGYIYLSYFFVGNHFFKVTNFFLTVLCMFILALSGYRANSLMLAIIFIISYQVYKKNYISYLYTLIGIVVMFLIIAVTAALRWGEEGLDYLTQAESYDLLMLYFSRSVAANTGLEEVFNKFKNFSDLLWGKSYIIDLVTLIPGEQPNFGLWLKDYLGMTFRGGSLMINESGIYYINFGYIGVCIMAFINANLICYIFKLMVSKSKNLFYISTCAVIGLTLSGLGDISTIIYSTSILIIINYLSYKILIR